MDASVLFFIISFSFLVFSFFLFLFVDKNKKKTPPFLEEDKNNSMKEEVFSEFLTEEESTISFDSESEKILEHSVDFHAELLKEQEYYASEQLTIPKGVVVETLEDDSHFEQNELLEQNPTEITQKIVSFQNRNFSFKEQILSKELDFSSIPYSNSISNHFKENNIHTFGDLPTDLDDFFKIAKGFGKGKVKTLYDFLETNTSLNVSSEEIPPIADEFLYVHEELLDIIFDDLKILEYVDFRYLSEFEGIHSFSDLSKIKKVDFKNKLESFTSSKKIKIYNLFHKMGVSLDINENNYITQEEKLKSILKDLSNQNNSFGLKDESWNCLQIKMNLDGEKPLTLVETGAQIGVTRERIRQILKLSSVGLVLQFISILLRFYRQNTASVQIDTIIDISDYTNDMLLCLQEILAYCNCDIYFNKDTISLFNRDITTASQLKKDLSDLFKEKKYYRIDIESREFEDFCSENDLPKDFVASFVEKELKKVENVFYSSSHLTNMIHEFLAKEEFPNGISLKDDLTKIKEGLSVLYPEFFEEASERSIISKITDPKDSPFHIWDRGVWVHRKHIKIEKQSLFKYVGFIKNYLENDASIPYISCNLPFNEFSDELINLGITNPYALYSCLEIYFPDNFNFLKAPKVSIKDLDSTPSMTEELDSFAKSFNRPFSLNEILDEFEIKRGWKRFSATQILYRNEKIIRVNFSDYLHLDAIELDLKHLRSVYVEIIKKYAVNNKIELKDVDLSNYTYLKEWKLDNYYALYYIAEALFDDLFSECIYPAVLIV